MAINPQILKNLIPLYASGIDLLINTYGKSITLHFEPTVTNVTSDLDDEVRVYSEKKPKYKSPSPPIVVENTLPLTVLIRHAPKDYQNFGLRVDNPQNLIRIKSYLTDSPNLQKCKYITIDSDPTGVINGKYKAIRLPIPFGLGVSRYALSYWERV